jgi:hypothetical protein
MAEVELACQLAMAELEGRENYCQTLEKACGERTAALGRLNRAIDIVTADLYDPPVHPISEAALNSVLGDVIVGKAELNSKIRESIQETHAEKQLKKLNENMQKQFAEAESREQRRNAGIRQLGKTLKFDAGLQIR